MDKNKLLLRFVASTILIITPDVHLYIGACNTSSDVNGDMEYAPVNLPQLIPVLRHKSLFYRVSFFVNGYTCPVSHSFASTGQRIEHCRFSRVWITCHCNSHDSSPPVIAFLLSLDYSNLYLKNKAT